MPARATGEAWGTSRVCDGRCHNAKGPRCACWCGGLFHGAGGEAAREAFRDTFAGDIPPKGEPAQLDWEWPDRWHAAVAAAHAASASSTSRSNGSRPQGDRGGRNIGRHARPVIRSGRKS